VAGIAALGLAGCAQYKHLSPPEPTAVRKLGNQLAALDTSVNPEEAQQLAACAYESSLELARQYRAVRPAWWQNVLVNAGLKKRGLCYEWAEDLTVQLRKLHPMTLELYWAVAWPHTPLEHNAVVVCAHGQPFDKGILLDAWRYSGKLHWGYVAHDWWAWHRGKDLPEVESPSAPTAQAAGSESGQRVLP
jgi:hypothetical protein